MPKKHRVEAGDCIASVAFENGFLPDRIWDHPENAALRDKRVTGNVLAAGDVLHLPDLDPDEVEKPCDQRHRFRRRGVPELLQIRLLDLLDQPRAGLSYHITVDGAARSGVTDGDGWIRQAIPANAQKAELKLETGEVYQIDLGHLPPHDCIAGVQQRLKNLGFACDEDRRGEVGDATRRAIAGFLDDAAAASRDWDSAAICEIGQKLRAAHGS